MTQITGIMKDNSTELYPTFVRINMKKHSDYIPKLKDTELEFSSKKNNLKNPAVTGVPPRGYVTLEQFAEDTKKIISNNKTIK